MKNSGLLRSVSRPSNVTQFLQKTSLLTLIASLLLPSAFASPPLVGTAETLPDLVEKVLPGVVNISSVTVLNAGIGTGMDEFLRFWGIPQERRHTSLGSGFIIDAEGHILTNYHVIAQADEVIVTFLDKKQLRARLVGGDQKMDVALLKVKDKQANPPVPLANSDKIRIGESVFAVGNPFGLQHTVTVGIVSAKNRTIGQGPFDNFIQTDASINPGNSGGPLFNFKGEVAGINTVIFSKTGQSGGLGFAIPINEAKALLPDLKRYGRVPRPWLGILGETMNPQLSRYYQLHVDEGVLIYNIVANGPADDSGFKRGDIITQVDGVAAKEAQEVERVLARHRPSDTITVKVARGRKFLTFTVKLEEMPRIDNLPPGII